MTPQESLEALMLMCFGLAWPVANLRMLRRRCPEGKGLAFTLIILMGYIAGALAKWPSISGLDLLPWVFWLYLANGGSVALNLFLQWHFGRVRVATPALQVAPGLSPTGS
jgi:hypothetical protein